MIETLFASINGYTTIPGKSNFYPKDSHEDLYNRIKVSEGDNLELTYENGFYNLNYTPTNVQLADPASIISSTNYGSWTYNLLVPKQFLLDILRANGVDFGYIQRGREGLIIQNTIEPLYTMYKAQGNSDKFVDFVAWMVKQINAYVGVKNLAIFISEYTFPSVRKIQYLDQTNSINADTNQGTQFGISHTKYKLRKGIRKPDNQNEGFYRLAIEVTTNPTVFAANKFRTDLTINDFDVANIKIDDFYVVHPKVKSQGSECKPLEFSVFDINKTISVQMDGATDLISRTKHGFVSGDELYFSSFNNVSGLGLNKVYYTVNITPDNFKISTQQSGVPLDFSNPSGGLGGGSIVYVTPSPLTISNYPDFTVSFGNSKNFVKPTINNYSKKEDVNLLERSLGLWSSIYKYSNLHTLKIGKTGNLIIRGDNPVSMSGYYYTGDTYKFMTSSAMNHLSAGSGLFDEQKSGDGSVFQVGTFFASTLLYGSVDTLLEGWDYNIYNIGGTNGSGIFKSTNETGFFGTQAINPVEKTGVYTLLSRNVTNYFNKNFSKIQEKLKEVVFESPEVYAWRESIKIAHGAYGGTNPFYSTETGKNTNNIQDFYCFIETDGYNQITNSTNIKDFYFIPVIQWKSNAKAVLELGMTGNVKQPFTFRL